MEGSLGSKMRSEWLAAEFAQVDEDGYGIVSEDVAVATICKLCPGFKEAKVRKMKNHWQIISHFYDLPFFLVKKKSCNTLRAKFRWRAGW